jgi:hypothetical protein
VRRIASVLGTVAALVSAAAAGAQPPSPSSTKPPSTKPAVGRLTLATPRLYRVDGRPVALARQTWRIVASASQYVAGQTVTFTITRNGRVLKTVAATLRPGRRGTGTAFTSFRLGAPGRVRVRAVRSATTTQRPRSVRGRIDVILPYAGYGSGGLRVRYLQRRLRAVGYAVHLSGRFDDQTDRAVIAFRKVNGMSRGGAAIARIYRQLARGRGGFRPRYRGHGRHMEADLSAQVLALIDANGRPYRVYHVSSGKPSTPTVLGSFYVYSKTPGYNSLGMLDSNYFIEGYAVHGYHEVPTYAASHGCIRAPIPDAANIYDWADLGTRIDVYD